MTERYDIGHRYPVQHDFSGEVLGGRYHLDRRIGCGGMATIYAATDQNTKGTVAVKVMHPEHDKDPDLVRRFTQEGQLAAQIRHPNLVPAYDLGWLGGRHYVVMELVEGEGLPAMMKDKPLPWERTVPLVLDLLAALAALHARDVAHRDVSPFNCMIEPFGEGVRARLLDLGYARVITESNLVLTSPEASESMIIWGTSRYIAPERLRGGTTDLRADVFSVGALWYTMLTGKKPPDPLEEEPTALLDRLTLPWQLLAVLRGALESRDRRYHSAVSMAEAITVALRNHARRLQARRAWLLAPALVLVVPAWFAVNALTPSVPACEAAPTSAAASGPVLPAADVPKRAQDRLALASKSDEPGTAKSDEPGTAKSDEPGTAKSDEPGTTKSDEPRPSNLRASLAKCKTHPTARLKIEYVPGEVLKVNGTQPLGDVGRCVEGVIEKHPPPQALTLTP